MSDKTLIAIAGANGRMGKELLTACCKQKNSLLAAALVRDEHNLVGMPVEVELNEADGIQLSYQSQKQLTDISANVLVDFTLPENTITNLEICKNRLLPIVIGTTGFTEKQQQRIVEASQSIPVLQASNMSIGVNLTLALLEKAAKSVGAMSSIRIEDTHHINKLDSPSGTAISMAQVMTNLLGGDYESTVTIKDAKTSTDSGKPSKCGKGRIKIISSREGDVVGDHKVIFQLEDERIEINHYAENRQIFAKGAITAAVFLAKQKSGLFSMRDVLGL